MSSIVPVAALSVDAKPVVEKLRDLLSTVGLGITLQGTHLSVRWYIDGQLVQVTMVVESVDDGNDDASEDFH